MISDARGGHVSPGIYTEEKEVTYSVQSLGITKLGLVGETLYGPAFESVEIENWSEFVDYFGGTSADKFKGTGAPKYELPYIAKSYLQESKKLNVVRVLGLSGYDAKTAWCISTAANSCPVVILRSKVSYDYISGNPCTTKSDNPAAVVSNITISNYSPITYDSACVQLSARSITSADKFGLIVTTTSGSEYGGKTFRYNVSMNPNDSDYIYNILSSSPSTGSTPIYIEAVYENAWDKTNKLDTITACTSATVTDFKEAYRYARTPWIVSDVFASKDSASTTATMHKLFRFITISDGDSSNYQVKVSISNIKPAEGIFDVLVRDFNDTDDNVMILEKFSKCNLVEGDSNYIALRIGTVDGGYASKSKYIAVEMNEGEDLKNCIPAGFLGYPMPQYGSLQRMTDIKYNRTLNASVKTNRQYFGLNSSVIDTDILSYKGKYAYTENDDNPSKLTNGFHMDSILSMSGQGFTSATTYVDGVSGYSFTTVSADGTYYSKTTNSNYTVNSRIPRLINADYLSLTIYKDINTRKFTMYFYGGFDGWDVNRTFRTNTDEYNANRYPAASSGSSAVTSYINAAGILGLPSTAITSDYYAYLAGYRVLSNPQDVEINVLATPGINWYDNTLLTEDVIDIVEDKEDGRGGDAIYVMASPRDLDVDSIIEEFANTEIQSSYACTYYPWVMYYDSSNKKYITLPATKDVVRNMAMTDNTSFPWFAPAGENRGVVDCVKADYKTTLPDEDKLYGSCINPVKTFGKDGVLIWGNKTTYNVETPTNRVNVRRLMIRIKELVIKASKGLIFEQYDDTLEKQFKSAVEPILADVKANRGLYDYRIKTECTEETRDQHILPAKILVKPTPALEYISISFVIYPESVEFDEN